MRLTKKSVMFVSASVAALLVFCAFSAAAAGAAEWSLKNGINSGGKEVTGVHTLKELGWTGGVEIGPKEKKAKEEFVLRVTVAGSKLVLKATEVLGSGDFIREEGKGVGKLVFQGLSVTQPAGCTPPASITTESLKFELAAVKGLLSETALKFLPEAGKVLASFKLAGTCGLAGIPIELNTTNGLFGETAMIRALAVNQPVEFSPAINAASGGNLTVGASAAEFTGKLELMVTGAKNAGKEWSPE